MSSEGLKVIMLAAICGQHHSDDCQSCRAVHESNSDRITSLQADLDAAREAVKDAYREGFYDGDEGQSDEEEMYREFQACWAISRARTTLTNLETQKES